MHAEAPWCNASPIPDVRKGTVTPCAEGRITERATMGLVIVITTILLAGTATVASLRRQA